MKYLLTRAHAVKVPDTLPMPLASLQHRVGFLSIDRRIQPIEIRVTVDLVARDTRELAPNAGTPW